MPPPAQIVASVQGIGTELHTIGTALKNSAAELAPRCGEDRACPGSGALSALSTLLTVLQEQADALSRSEQALACQVLQRTLASVRIWAVLIHPCDVAGRTRGSCRLRRRVGRCAPAQNAHTGVHGDVDLHARIHSRTVRAQIQHTSGVIEEQTLRAHRPTGAETEDLLAIDVPTSLGCDVGLGGGHRWGGHVAEEDESRPASQAHHAEGRERGAASAGVWERVSESGFTFEAAALQDSQSSGRTHAGAGILGVPRSRA